MPIRIAIDAMSGDLGAASTVAATALFIKSHKASEAPIIYLVGQESAIESALTKNKLKLGPNLQIVSASEVVEMDEAPSTALRNKKDSSMRVAINMVKAKEADVAISAGNTGALMATAKFVLKTIPGIDRPALCTMFPTLDEQHKFGHVHVLDLGANIDSSAQQLAQFGMMGSVLSNVLDANDEPRVSLLNIGQEDVKGNEQVKQAAELLEQTRLNYTGFVEGDSIFKGITDVVICDGFVGNAVLKTMEGTAKLIAQSLKDEFKRTWYTKLSALLVYPLLKRFSKTIDPRNYNGAPLLGLNGLVFKSHGSADAKSFANAIKLGYRAAQNDLVGRTSDRIAHSMLNHQNINNGK